MPTSETPIRENEPNGQDQTSPETGVASQAEDEAVRDPRLVAPAEDSAQPIVRGSRWVDYDTHELLEMISDLEDERRWARLREGIWIAILIHLALISAVTWIPKYVFNVAPVIDPIDAIKNRKDLTYLDLPPDALRKLQPKVVVKPVPEKQQTIDKKTLDAMKQTTPPPVQQPEPQPATPEPPAPTPPAAQIQPQLELPHPKEVPARPQFAMGSQDPSSQLRQAMRDSRNSNPGYGNMPSGGGLAMHPGAGTGGIEVLSDTQGVDFSPWLQRWHHETQRTWDPLIPDEVNPPILKSGTVAIRFKVLPNGRLMEGSLVLEGRSGDVALDRAAWGALTGSNYPPLPRDFHGPYLELRAYFLYNMEPPR